MKEIKDLIELSFKKSKIDKKRGEDKYFDFYWLLDQIKDEIYEVKDEIKRDNIPYLEDELGDILWGWIILISKLKEDGYVDSHEAIFKRVLKKYNERITPLKGDEGDNEIWNNVKMRQKEALELEAKQI